MKYIKLFEQYSESSLEVPVKLEKDLFGYYDAIKHDETETISQLRDFLVSELDEKTVTGIDKVINHALKTGYTKTVAVNFILTDYELADERMLKAKLRSIMP